MVDVDTAALWSDVLVWLLTAFAGWLLGYAGERLRGEKLRRLESREHEELLREGVRLLLRGELIRLHDRHVVQGEPIDLSARECIQKTYEAYRVLGGNELGTQLYEELLAVKMGSL